MARNRDTGMHRRLGEKEKFGGKIGLRKQFWITENGRMSIHDLEITMSPSKHLFRMISDLGCVKNRAAQISLCTAT